MRISGIAVHRIAIADPPLRSSYGLHLVRVEQRRPGGPPPLAEVREAVRHDWIEERRAEARRAKLDDLRRHYDLRGVP